MMYNYILCHSVLLACALFFVAMCISWMVTWLHMLWWPVCVDYEPSMRLSLLHMGGGYMMLTGVESM
jgi:hypothetical protein